MAKSFHSANLRTNGHGARTRVKVSTVQYSTVQYSTAPYSTVRYSTVSSSDDQRGRHRAPTLND
eukprot:848345-Prorocentrum_minimum.AAC.1